MGSSFSGSCLPCLQGSTCGATQSKTGVIKKEWCMDNAVCVVMSSCPLAAACHSRTAHALASKHKSQLLALHLHRHAPNAYCKPSPLESCLCFAYTSDAIPHVCAQHMSSLPCPSMCSAHTPPTMTQPTSPCPPLLPLLLHTWACCRCSYTPGSAGPLNPCHARAVAHTLPHLRSANTPDAMAYACAQRTSLTPWPTRIEAPGAMAYLCAQSARIMF